MKITPYVQFNGNCADAIPLYEKAFGTSAQIARYKDAPPSEHFKPPEGTENLIMHAEIRLKEYTIMFCDMPQNDPVTAGDNIILMVSFKDEKSLKAAFDILKEGGSVITEPQETFWSKCFASLKDSFGIGWSFTVEYCEE